jgi:hypothetical protein
MKPNMTPISWPVEGAATKPFLLSDMIAVLSRVFFVFWSRLSLGSESLDDLGQTLSGRRARLSGLKEG